MPITAPPLPLSRISLFKGFVGVFLPLCLVLAVVGVLHYYTSYTAERRTREASESLNVDLARRTIDSDIGIVVSDLMFLAEHLEQRNLFGGNEVYGSRYPEAWRRISSQTSGQFQNQVGLFTFATIYPERVTLAAVHPVTEEQPPWRRTADSGRSYPDSPAASSSPPRSSSCTST